MCASCDPNGRLIRGATVVGLVDAQAAKAARDRRYRARLADRVAA